jgi:hypothetical protein
MGMRPDMAQASWCPYQAPCVGFAAGGVAVLEARVKLGPQLAKPDLVGEETPHGLNW